MNLVVNIGMSLMANQPGDWLSWLCVYHLNSFGKEPDQDSEWEHKLSEVRAHLCELLPLAKAAELFELYSCHVNARKGIKPNSVEARAYRKLLELEEAILLWEELQKEQKTSSKSLLTKMKEVGFPGM